MSKLIGYLFGASWKTSLVGLVGAVLTAAVPFLQSIPPDQGIGWYILAIVIGSIGRLAKDSNVTGGTTPNTGG